MRSVMLLCALCACDCMLDRTAPGVQQLGSEPPPRAEEVIAASASICDRDLRGTITWAPAPHICGAAAFGCSRVGGCHLDATVFWSPEYEPMPTALETALAHEIGHYCRETADEAGADDFAVEVRNVIADADGAEERDDP